VDDLLQRLTEANMILPVLAISILVFALYNINLWIILGVVIFLKAFSSPVKSFRAAFMQVKEAPYVEAAQAYGASDPRIILKYMVPRIFPVLIPQMVTLIPSLVFLEATLGLFNVYDPRFPTWGRVIYGALVNNALWGGSAYWVLEPLSLLLLTALGFSLFGYALERILNPRLLTR
jgi:peptide/nickel transport system permease protein